MTIASIAALCGTSLAIAVVPGPSDFLVVGRSMASGFRHGLAVTLGIISADYLFILAAIYGLGFIADQMGGLFEAVKYACGLYLLGLGLSTRVRRPIDAIFDEHDRLTFASSFSSGLVITLGDPKAILFYAGLLPAFVDLASITWREAVIVIAAATVTVAGVKLTYAYLAGQAREWLENTHARARMQVISGAVLAGTGGFLLAMTYVSR